MPESVTVADRRLQLNGAGVRKEKAFFKAYVVGLYLEEPTRDGPAAIGTDKVKRIVLRMLRDVSRDAFVRAIEAGLMRNSSAEMPLLRERLDLLERVLPSLKEGNILELTYLPRIGTVFRGQSQEMTIAGKDFADAMFSVWLGQKPLSEILKDQLLGRVLQTGDKA